MRGSPRTSTRTPAARSHEAPRRQQIAHDGIEQHAEHGVMPAMARLLRSDPRNSGSANRSCQCATVKGD